MEQLNSMGGKVIEENNVDMSIFEEAGVPTQCMEEIQDIVLQQSLCSDKAILAHMTRGNIVISPFNFSNLSTSSYDVTLGAHYYREVDPEAGRAIYNPYSAEHVQRVWGEPRSAELVSDWCARTEGKLENIGLNERIIWLKPGETILGHTEQFIGGRNTVTTMMKARSSLGRNFIEVCKCAG
jgi:deoxycytidine triphosphate deaminase